jgi:hypothetical protein
MQDSLGRMGVPRAECRRQSDSSLSSLALALLAFLPQSAMAGDWHISHTFDPLGTAYLLQLHDLGRDLKPSSSPLLRRYGSDGKLLVLRIE